MVELGREQKASGGPSFADVVGQEKLKEALLAVATDDGLDGLLVRGEKGTAKSTAVRALAGALPAQRAVADCPYGCPPDEPQRQCGECRDRSEPPVEKRRVPLVTLPLGATRDRVVGTLSVADALEGAHEFEPGLLARANRGVLYVDEVNLLEDHLVDVLLDAAAAGVNRVERDGVSVAHPAEFTLVGTMNPEEGDLRPQLRDRFALSVSVTACEDVDDRVAIIEAALERDGRNGNAGTGDATSGGVRSRITDARARLEEVDLPGESAAEIARLCRSAGVDGHRGDIATARTARTLAALAGRSTVLENDLQRAARLALPHRLQSRPFEDAPDPEEAIDEFFEDGTGGESGDGESEAPAGESAPDPGDGADRDGDGDAEPDAESSGPETGERDGAGPEPDANAGPANGGNADTDDGAAPDPTAGAGAGSGDPETEGGSDRGDGSEAAPLVPGQSRESAAVGESRAPATDVPAGRAGSAGADGGRGTASTGRRGARVRTEPAQGGEDVDAAASVRAAASRGSADIGSRDLRQSVRAGAASALVVFAVDASASMRPAMRAAKGTVLELLKDAYEHRDEVAFVAFAGEDGEVLLPPTDSVTLAARHLKDLPTGDRTPLAAGLETAAAVLERADPATSLVVPVTDGRANAAGDPVAATRAAAQRLARQASQVLVVDAGEERAGLVDLVVDTTGGDRVPLDALSAERVDAAVGSDGSPESECHE